MRRAVALTLFAASLASVAHADPLPEAGSGAPAAASLPDPNTVQPTVAVLPEAHDDKHPIASAAIVGGLYVGFSAWAYAAWYAKHKPLGYFKWGGDGWLGDRTYAGGEDKFGHAWATMSLARAGTYILSDYGGFDHRTSSFVSAGLAETLFFFVEVKDGFFYEFSFSDLTGDTCGAIAALLLDNFPRLDEMFDYRVQYFPSSAYYDNISHGNGYSRLNIAEDYSGETFLLAYHLGSLHALDTYAPWPKFVDLTLGFDTRGYKPSPPAGFPPYDHHQNMFIGVSFNAQGFFDWLFTGPTKHSTARTITHALGEVFNLPYSSTYLLEYSREPTGKVNTGGA